MNISQARLEEVTKDILLESLHKGLVPTADYLQKSLRTKLEDKDITLPFHVQPSVPQFNYLENSSASKTNQIFDTMISDLNMLYDLYTAIEKSAIEVSDRVQLKLLNIEKRIAQLLSRINRLLLVTNRTEGFLDYVGDSFIDKSKVDQTRTTAIIDLTGQAAYGGYLTDRVPVTETTDLSAIQNTNIQVTPLDPRLSRSPGTTNSQLTDMLSDSNTPWIYTVSSEQPIPASIEIQINFAPVIEQYAAPVEATKIILNPYITNNSFLVLVQYSEDGIIWNDLPVASPARRIEGPTLFLFEPLNMTNLRLIMTSDTHSRLGLGTHKFIYEFGIRELVVHGTLARYAEETELVSSQLTLLDEDGERQQFTQVALSAVCEDVPGDTQIEYQIAFLVPDGGNLVEGEFQKIVPLTRGDIDGASTLVVDSLSTSLSPQNIDATPPAFAASTNKANKLLDTDVTSVSKVWRNVGDKTRYYLTRQNDQLATEDGWFFTGTHYQTYVYVSDQGGKIFDFGERPLDIDGLRVSGKVRLSKGNHFVSTPATNWTSLKGLYGVVSFNEATKRFTGNQRAFGASGLEDDEVLDNSYSVIDHLYPYNHKLIIEGLDYSEIFNQDILKPKYTGVARYASKLLEKVSPTDLESNTTNDDYSRFSVVNTASETQRVMVKWQQYQDELPREDFLVETKSADFAEGVVLKAIFRTTNPLRTATLEGYEIKLAQ